MDITLDTTPHSTDGFSNDASRLASIVDAAIERLGSATLVSQGHCIDVLLDLYTATDDIGLKWSIGERIEELRGRSVLFAGELRADLEALVEIADFTGFVDSLRAA
jgi:hypothetical protein